MRIVFVGAGEVTVRTAEFLINKGHEVVIVDSDRSRIEELSESMDCSFLHGDGSNPKILKEVDPDGTDVLLSLSDSDQANLIASLVGRSLAFKRVITTIHDPSFEEICRELGLEDTIIPSRMISRYIADMVEGINALELTTIIKDTARFFTFIAHKEDAGPVAGLDLPEQARVICYYRDGRFSLADEDTKLKKDDEVVVLTDSASLNALEERWKGKRENDTEKEEAS